MGTFLVYNLKLSICFLLFYLLYKVLLCRNTFHRTNRIVLLAAYLFTLFIPLISFETTRPLEIHEIISDYEWLILQSFYVPTETVLTQPAFHWAHIVVLIYAIGVVSFACRYFYFLIQIIFRIRTGEKIRLDNNIVLVISEKTQTPFSWMRYIVLPKTDTEENRHAILSHEQAHVKSRHSLDLLIADLLAIVQWYNPAIWLMKSELQDVHEYEADEVTLHSGVNAKQYHLLLIKKTAGSLFFNAMTNSFNHSKLKKRITMMLRKKNSHWVRLKYVSILPLAALAVVLFARPEVSNKLDEISAVKVSDFTSINEVNVESSIKKEESKVVRLTQDENSVAKEIIAAKSQSAAAAAITFAQQQIEKIQLKRDSLKRDIAIIEALIEYLESRRDDLWIDSFKDELKTQLCFVDGVEVPDLESVNLADIHSVTVRKDSSTTSMYGARGANGVVWFTTKAKAKTGPLLIVDGVEASDFSSVKPEDIESISMLKADTAISVYGEKGVNGVIIITTRK